MGSFLFILYSWIIPDDNILWFTAAEYGLIKLDIQNDSVAIYPLQTEQTGWLSWIQPYPGKGKSNCYLGAQSYYLLTKYQGSSMKSWH